MKHWKYSLIIYNSTRVQKYQNQNMDKTYCLDWRTNTKIQFLSMQIDRSRLNNDVKRMEGEVTKKKVGFF